MTRRLRMTLLAFGALASIVCGVSSVKAQTTVALMPIPKPSFYGQNGLPLAGCKIFTYQSGTSTPQGTFTDATGTIPNPNPVTCDAGGFVNPGIWLIVGDTYRILVQDQFGVQQYLVDGVVGVGGGSLNLFSTPNTWTALQTFSAGASINGGNLTGTFTGSPAFTGTPQFTTFTISNTSVIANLNASLWNGTSVNAGGALTTGFVPVVSAGGAATWNNLPSIAGVAALGQLPGSGVTTIDGVSCTIGSACSHFPLVVYSTASASSNANIVATTMTTPATNATYRFTFYVTESVIGTSCTGNTTVQVNILYQDPLAAGINTFSAGTYQIAVSGNGTVGIASQPNGTFAAVGLIRGKAGVVIQYSTTFTAGTGCSPAPQYILYPILEQLTSN